MTVPALLRGVDRAAFAVALVARLRTGGVLVSASGPAAFVSALDLAHPRTRDDLYWNARLTLVNRAEDLVAFDTVFDSLFGDWMRGLDVIGRRRGPGSMAGAPGDRAGHGGATEGGGLPWVTRPASIVAADSAETGVTIPDTLPSRLAARADESFDAFDEADLRLLGTWLEDAVDRWPRRQSLRRESHRHGARIDFRQTMKASRSTGWEPLLLARTRPRVRPRRVVLACDVSRSMQPYATIYLHLMRAAALRRNGMRPEVFAFATSLTRLTPALAHRSAEVALERANEKVSDRYGGTHLGRSIAGLLGSQHGSALRGAVVIIASDGWDADPPEVLDHAMVRVRRRANRIVWLNPRAAAPDYRPLAGSMAAALPYCDVFAPANSIRALGELFTALGT